MPSSLRARNRLANTKRKSRKSLKTSANGMPKAVLDSTVLISALLAPEGVCDQLLRQGLLGAFVVCLSEAIPEETQRVLLEEERLRRRYSYTNDDVEECIPKLRGAASMVSDVPLLEGISRDP